MQSCIAHDLRIPIIRLVDGTGGGGSVRSFETLKRTYVPEMASFDVIVKVMGMVPVIAGCMGSVAGIGAARVAASHFSVMIRGTSQLFVAGPPVVKWGTGEDLTKEELGGSEIHAHVSGAVDNEVESEDEALRADSPLSCRIFRRTCGRSRRMRSRMTSPTAARRSC